MESTYCCFQNLLLKKLELKNFNGNIKKTY